MNTSRHTRDRTTKGEFALSLFSVKPHQGLGYYTLSNYSLASRHFTGHPRFKGVKYPQRPLHLLGRLAVDLRVQGQGIGSMLLKSAISAVLESHRFSGSMGNLTEPIDQNAVRFYEHFDFVELEVGRSWFPGMDKLHAFSLP
ncbi:GNAT family N-acetyltransferase [bacterium]|nr:GNAT family N-acetyltransferase [bacterium]